MSTEDFREDVLLHAEIESYVGFLVPSNAIELGSLSWIEKHERIKQLTMQAVVQAVSNREETVKEFLISNEKIGHNNYTSTTLAHSEGNHMVPTDCLGRFYSISVSGELPYIEALSQSNAYSREDCLDYFLNVVIHDLILVELWRETVLSELLAQKQECNFSLYTILYHESTCINLLETVLFHPDAAETVGDNILDLTDYCLRALNGLLVLTTYDENEIAGDVGIDQQFNVLRLGIAFKSLTCLRYVIENLDKVVCGTIRRLIISSDTPMLLTEILIAKPWRRMRKSGEEVEYNCSEHRWAEVNPSNRLIGNIEVQAWLAIYQIFMNSQVITSYEIHDFRKNQLLKLRPMLHDVALDQIPVLTEFQRWLNQLAITSGPAIPSKSNLIIEMLPPIRTALEAEFKRNRNLIFESCQKELISSSRELITQKAKRLAAVYDFDSVLPLSKCVNCGDAATKRCSRCLNEWYCCRECQVTHWRKHKVACDLIALAK